MKKNRLILVMNLKTGDIKWAENFYPVRRIREECKKSEIDFNFVLEKDFQNWFTSFFLSEKQSPSGHRECFWLRGVTDPLIFDLLESENCLFFNSRESTELAGDKLKTIEKFSGTIIKTPEVFSLSETVDNYPVIFKPRYGKMGEGIHIIHNGDEFKNILESVTQKGLDIKDFVIQECITDSLGKDIRILFCNGKITGALKRHNPENFLSNGCKGGKSFVYHPVKKLKKAAEFIIEKSGLFCGSMDFLYSGKEFYLCELNSFPGFEHSEKDTGKNFVSPWIREIKSFMDKN